MPITDLYPLGVVDERGEDDDAEDEEEHEEEQFLGRRLGRLQQDLEPGRVPRQFEQPVRGEEAERGTESVEKEEEETAKSVIFRRFVGVIEAGYNVKTDHA